MLTPETPFPNVGSYALLIDEDQPPRLQRAELVRLFTRPCNATVTVAFPLREGASGTKTVPAPALIDATPLTGREAREMIDLGGELLRSRVRNRARKQARHEALKSRALWTPHMLRLLDEATKRKAA